MDSIQIQSRLYDYEVAFTDDFAKDFKDYADAAVYVIDKNVYDFNTEKFQEISSEKIFFMDAVEEMKNMDTVMKIVEFFRKAGVLKNWKVICIGGGITQDVTTMASDLYLRNIDWIFYPTTLLSMCDSCIGGKCGLNLGAYKNQIGVFYPPKKIVIDTGFLQTLKEADIINGWGELLKFSLTDGEEFYEKLEREQSYISCKSIAKYIYQGLLVKKKVIEEDEFESDKRRILNYGHTFGHALEAYTKNKVPHGKAVIWGIDVVNYIAYREGLFQKDDYLEIKALIKQAFLVKEMTIAEPQVLFAIVKTDKKVKGDVISLALPDRKGHLTVYPMHLDKHMEELLEDFLEETHEYYKNDRER